MVEANLINNTNHDNNSSSLINPVVHEGELRILDIDLAQRLGFERPRDIRKLINRYSNELDRMGVRATVAQTPSSAGGRPTLAFYLNRKQAIFITAKSETKEATEITIEIIERFEAYERGEINQFHIPQSLPEALRLAADQAEQIKELKPKADALDLIASHDGLYCLRVAAKNLEMKPMALIDYLSQHRWIHKNQGKGNWIAYQGRIDAGYLKHKSVYIHNSDQELVEKSQVLITPKGLTKLGHIFSKEPV